MIAFWRELRMRPPSDDNLGASMPMPQQSSAAPSWLTALSPLAEEDYGSSSGGGSGGGAGGISSSEPVPVAPTSVPAVWEPVVESDGLQAPSYDACFQGF